MDHLGGNAEMKDAGAEIAIHSADVERTRSNQGHLDRARSGLTLLGLEDRAPAREAMLLRLLGREVGCDRELDDGDVVDLGLGREADGGAHAGAHAGRGLLPLGGDRHPDHRRLDPGARESGRRHAGAGGSEHLRGQPEEGRERRRELAVHGARVQGAGRRPRAGGDGWERERRCSARAWRFTRPGPARCSRRSPSCRTAARASGRCGRPRCCASSTALGDADSGYPSSGTTTIPAYLRVAGA